MTAENSARRANDLGWDDRWSACLQVAALSTPQDELTPARVVAVHRGSVIVQPLPSDPDSGEPLPETETIDLAAPSNADDDAHWPPIVGDWVGLSARRGTTTIAAILPRRTYLERPSASRSSAGQPVAANIDALVIVEPMRPSPSAGRIERFTALARSAGVEAWLVLTKADLDTEQVIADALATLGRYTDRALATSDTDPATLEALYALLPIGTTAVLVGRSGAGKSTLTNALLGTTLPTGEVRQGDAKGRHTTTSRQLVTSGGISLIDTPGIRALAATDDAEAIDEAFQDIADIARTCRYSDCSHTGEHGCAVAEAVASGALDPDRVERYQRMLSDSARLSARQNVRLFRERERRAARDNTRGRRATMRLKGRGPGE